MNIYSKFSIEGKTILVTGASSGIGRQIAITCSEMGANVIITARNEDRLKETMSQMEDNNHFCYCADITQNDQLVHLVNSLPKLDGLVQNAGVGSRIMCKSISQADIDYTMHINFDAPVLLQTELLKQKKINKSASIVYIASRAASSPSIGNAIYSASKGAIISYARCLALELAPRQIRVNCICPAMVWTDLILQGGLTKEDFEEAQQKYPLKRYGTPVDVANLATFLLSDASSWMTGSCVDLTGGGE